MVEPAEMPSPSHPHILSRRNIGVPQTSSHDACATRECLPGPRKLAVKVVDIFGNDTMTIVEVSVGGKK